MSAHVAIEVQASTVQKKREMLDEPSCAERKGGGTPSNGSLNAASMRETAGSSDRSAHVGRNHGCLGAFRMPVEAVGVLAALVILSQNTGLRSTMVH